MLQDGFRRLRQLATALTRHLSLSDAWSHGPARTLSVDERLVARERKIAHERERALERQIIDGRARLKRIAEELLTDELRYAEIRKLGDDLDREARDIRRKRSPDASGAEASHSSQV